MELALWREIVACLPQGRTLFSYGRDQYAFMLLCYLLGTGRSLPEIKSGQFAPLFTKPTVREYFAGRGELRATQAELATRFDPDASLWRLTLARWGDECADWRYNQTCRKGYNLVLQLNFTGVHNTAFDRDVGACVNKLLHWHCHPVSTAHRTLAWARLDLDLDTGEVMIEEIQTDYLRLVNRYTKTPELSSYQLSRLCPRHHKLYARKGALQRAMKHYRESYLADAKFWDEIMLAATLDFCVNELGCPSVFFHQFQCGAHLKHINGCKPPRSLYTRLPRRFCFSPTEQGPEFLRYQTRPRHMKARQRLRKAGGPAFWHLDFTA